MGNKDLPKICQSCQLIDQVNRLKETADYYKDLSNKLTGTICNLSKLGYSPNPTKRTSDNTVLHIVYKKTKNADSGN